MNAVIESLKVKSVHRVNKVGLGHINAVLGSKLAFNLIKDAILGSCSKSVISARRAAVAERSSDRWLR